MDLASLKNKSIIEVAASLGLALKLVSSKVYEHPDHDSFRIFADTNTFKWFSRDIQGDVIDFIRLIQGVSFKEAVAYLEGHTFSGRERQSILPKIFHYSLIQVEDRSFKLARSYLKKVRGLSDETINFFGRQGVLAQASWVTKGVVEPVLVFKSFDHRHHLQGASLQGIHKNPVHKRGRLKQIMKGSQGHIGIAVDVGKPQRLIFCESVIDMMSYYQLHESTLSDVRLVSMEGLKQSVVAYQTLRLIAEEKGKPEFLDTLPTSRLLSAMCAVRDTTDYFREHPDFIRLAVDNDLAGQEFIQKLRDADLPVTEDFPDSIPGKTKVDWNDCLVHSIVQPEPECVSNQAYSLDL